MKKTKEILNIILIMMIIVTIIVINKSYALFESNVDLLINMDVASWNITVNDTAVKSSSVETFVSRDIALDANSKVADGKVAPGSQGSFNINMDFKDTDVSVEGEININGQKMKEAGLTFSGFVMDDTDITCSLIEENKYRFMVPLSKIKSGSESYKLQLGINFKWSNNEARNKEDTLIGISTTRLKMEVPITIKFTQYTGL